MTETNTPAVTSTSTARFSESVEFAPSHLTWEQPIKFDAPAEAEEKPTHNQPTESAAPTSKILGKFNSQADLEKAYQELERKLSTTSSSRPQQQQTPEAPRPHQEETNGTPTEQRAPSDKSDGGNAEEADAPLEAEDIAKASGVDVERFSTEFDTNGSLSEESYKELAEKHHLPKELVDEFIAYRLNARDAFNARVNEAAGGDLPGLIGWASANLTPAEVDGFNAAMDATKTPEGKVALIESLKAKHDRATPKAPARVLEGGTNTAPGGSSSGGYATEADWRADFRSERYKRDASFREHVNRKMTASPWFRQ